VEGGQPARIRCEPVTSQTISADGFTLLFASLSAADIEIRKAHPENSPFQVVARIPNSRIPGEVALWQPTLSPNRKSLVMPLIDKGTTNLWIMPADGGPLRRMTDFGSRSTLIERRVSWSPDGKFVYAALADTDADIVLLKHLLP